MVDQESAVVVIQAHVAEDAVDVAGRLVGCEFPLLELGDGLIGDGQFGFAFVAVLVQVLAGRDLELGVCLARKKIQN